MTSHSTAPPSRKTKPCRYYSKGNCRNGDECDFIHDVVVQDTHSHHAPVAPPSTPPKHAKICFAWKAGTCTRGSKCWFSHDIDPQRPGLESPSSPSVEYRSLQAGHVQMQAAEAAARRLANEEAAKTISHVISGSIVTFSAGLDVSNLLTGFETCTIRIGNLPVDMTHDDIHALLRGHPPDVNCFHIVKVEKQDWRLEAHVVADVASGEELASALNGVKFENEILMVEASNSPDGMSAAGDQSPVILTIIWCAPSARYLAAFDDVATANAKVEQLRDYYCDGRRIKVELNIPPLDRSRSDLPRNAIKINNLPSTVTPKKVMDLTGSKTVRRLPILGLFEQPTVEEIARDIRHDIERAIPGGLKKFDNPSNTCTEEGDVSARAHFCTWDEARVAYTHLRDKRYGSQLLRLELRDPMSFTLYIPEAQYRAQKAQWDSLSESVKDNEACTFYTRTSGSRVQVILEGSVKETVGALKVRVESLAWGEMVEGWHRSLGIPGNLFVSRVQSVTGAYLRADCEQELLKVYGTPTAIDRARAMIKDELNRLASLDYTVTIEPSSVGFFVREGIPQLKEKFGEDSVRFVMSSRKITILGGEEARHTLDRLVALSRKGSSGLHNASRGSPTCPICYDGVSSPLQLGCGHTYCVTCLRLFVLSALESDRLLPLTCLGDEACCRAPIPIHTMQQILSLASLNRLLEAAFDAYIAKHPREFKHCKTQDCTQLYRAVRTGAAPQTLHCPSCFSAVCNGCHEEAHDGLSCAQSKARRNFAEQEQLDDAWIASQDGRVKRCPQCCKPIEKDQRRNVVSCRCGAYVCWRCMGILTPATVEPHQRICGYNDETISRRELAVPQPLPRVEERNAPPPYEEIGAHDLYGSEGWREGPQERMGNRRPQRWREVGEQGGSGSGEHRRPQQQQTPQRAQIRRTGLTR